MIDPGFDCSPSQAISILPGLIVASILLEARAVSIFNPICSCHCSFGSNFYVHIKLKNEESKPFTSNHFNEQQPTKSPTTNRKKMGPSPSKHSSSSTESSKSLSKYPVVGPNSIMSKKKHGTSNHPVQETLRWNVSRKKADQICNFNRHFAEPSGSAFSNSKYMEEFQEAKSNKDQIQFYDSNTGTLLFTAPRTRSHHAFCVESKSHGWPSFRDDEVNWEYVRCLSNGECVSIDGTHLGHNLPDRNGNRYCINLVSVAGIPSEQPHK